MPPSLRHLRLVAFITLAATTASAQTARPIDGPPAPIAPEVITRDAKGQATIRAIKLTAPLKLDGVLDEEVYSREKPFGGLIQVAPDFGKPATERSDIWVMYDDQNIYVTCRCFDEAPASLWIVNELRRDTGGLRNNEHFGVLFDTYYDRRSGFAFYANPLGARADYSVVDEGGSNTDWNPVWTVKPGRFEGGWTVEMAIPLKSLRYRAGKDEVWGIQMRRSIRHKNEWDYLTPVPRILAGPQALNKVSTGGTLVGLDLPEAGANVEVKPYAITRSTTDNLRTPRITDQIASDASGDIKYAVTPNLTADLTVNTDFAQVEIDEQQVNLTRFNLFFPEKRDFFLEGRGIFDFARGGLGATSTDQSDLPYLFYSRRIGLNGSRVIPISGGGRLTGKVGPWAVGLMDIQTKGDGAVGANATNFGIVRLKRDVLSRSAIGLMATNRSVGATGTGTNSAFGVDGTFILSQALLVSTYWAQTNTTGKTGNNQSYMGLVDYSDDTYGAHAERVAVGANFDPQVGFKRRSDFTRSFASARFSPRPTAYIPSVRKFTWTASEQYVRDWIGHGRFARVQRLVQHRVPEQRSVPADLHASVRTLAGAVHAVGLTGRDSGRYVRLSVGVGRVHVGRTATRVGNAHRAGRRVLRRHDPQRDVRFGGRRVPDRTNLGVPAPRVRAVGDVHGDLARQGFVRDATRAHTRGLRVLAADVSERIVPIHVGGPDVQHQPALPVGIRTGQ